MKTKISRILGVGLVLLMVVSLFGVFAPVKEAQAAEGNVQWTVQPLPTATFNVLDNGANAVNPTYFAVGPDGLTIYALNSTLPANAAGCILKSTDGGQSFLAITAPGTVNGVLSYVAVSPTNPSVVVAAELITGIAAIDNAYVSTNGGVTWTALPAIAGAATCRIRGLAVSPDRTDSLLNRDYVVAVSDNVAGAFAAANGLQIIGATPAAGWVAFGTAASDYLAVAFSPNYLGDHAVLAVSTRAAANGTSAEVWNNTEPAVAPALYPTTVPFPRILNATAVEAAAANETADIAMPIDFDPTSPAGMRFWVGVASVVAEPGVGAGGIYRVDAAANPELLAIGLTGTRVNSVAYSGTVAGGTLFAGFQTPGGINNICATVSYTTQAQSNLPVWTPCLKPPTGLGVGGIGRPIVRVSPGFTADKKVYAMTTGAESAFSVSTDAGVSFNQKAIINLGAATVGVIDGLVLTPDGKTLFVVSRGAARVSVWQTATAPSAISWSRIWCANAVNPCLIALNSSGWATAPEIYLVNTVVGTPNGMFASYDGGASFNIRSTPNVTTAAISVASSKVVFIANGVAAPTTVYKSTVGGSVWSSPVPANANVIVSLATVGNDVLVGGTGACSRSTDGGTSFVSLTTAGLTANGFICIPDENYATNKIVYAGDTAAAAINNVYRINADTGAIWENILNPVATAIVGMGMSNGAFYAQSGGAAIACDRTLGPRDAVGTITWRTMNIPASANVILRFSVAQNKVYVSTGVAATLWAYGDSLATAKTKLNTPASGTKVAVDPVTGRAQVLMVSWDAMGSGTGLANTYTFGIFEKAQGVPGASFIGIGPMPIPTAPRCSIWPSGPSGGPAVTAPDFVYTFLAGVEYGIIIRAADEVSADVIVSPWSDPVYFTIEAATGIITAPYGGPQLQAPTPGAMGVSLTPGFAWAPVSGAVSYEFELSKSAATTARGYFIDALVGLTGANALVTPGWQCDKTLDYSTSYFWHVKGINATGGESIWGTAQFTTIPAGVFTCPLDGLTFATQAELEAHNAAAHAPVIPQTPAYIWAVVIIGAILVIVVIALIFTTRRVS